MKSFKVCIRKKGIFLDYQGWMYDLSPPDYVKISLPPDVLGVDSLLLNSMKQKGIEGDFFVKICDNADSEYEAEATYLNSFMEGWIYDVRYVKINKKVWICSYLKFMYETPPKTIRVSLEST